MLWKRNRTGERPGSELLAFFDNPIPYKVIQGRFCLKGVSLGSSSRTSLESSTHLPAGFGICQSPLQTVAGGINDFAAEIPGHVQLP